jgi:hypothetical protein
MRTALTCCLLFATMAWAENGPAVQVKRVASLTWDLQTGKLTWVVQTRAEDTAEFASSSNEQYEISPKDATMTFHGEARPFTSQEATWLENLLHILAGYCVASTIWWHGGQILPMPDGEPPATPQPDQPRTKPTQAPANPPTKVATPKSEKLLPLVQRVQSDRP